MRISEILTSQVTFLRFDKIYLQNNETTGDYMQNNISSFVFYRFIAVEHLKLRELLTQLLITVEHQHFLFYLVRRGPAAGHVANIRYQIWKQMLIKKAINRLIKERRKAIF